MGTEAGRLDVVRFSLAVYRLREAAGKDPASGERSETSRLDNPLDPYHVEPSQLEAQFQITETELAHYRLMAA